MVICIFLHLIEKQKVKEVSTGYCLMVKGRVGTVAPSLSSSAPSTVASQIAEDQNESGAEEQDGGDEADEGNDDNNE